MEQVEGTAVQDFDRACETIEPPRLASPLVFSSPHSGSTYPQRFLAASRLDPLTLRRSEDDRRYSEGTLGEDQCSEEKVMGHKIDRENHAAFNP